MLDRLRTAFSIDLRSLALFRVCLALMILYDLLLRSFKISVFYTDAGVLPRSLWLNSTHHFHWSLHSASGLLWYQVLLFVLAAIFAVCLLVGYRTRVMTALSWVMLQSLINRNNYLSQGGDELLVLLAFWGMFLPLNARFSIDAALSESHRRQPLAQHPRASAQDANMYFSVATVAVLLQVMYLYIFTAILKTGDAWRVDFDAAWWAVSIKHYSTPIGLFISQYPGFLKLATMSVMVLEFVALFTIFSPWYHVPLRLVTLAALYLLHASFLLMLYIGLFPLIDFTALTLLIPGALWVWLERRRGTPPGEPVVLYHAQGAGLARKLSLIAREFFLPASTRVEPIPADAAAVAKHRRGWVVQNHDGALLSGRQALVYTLSRGRLARVLLWPLRALLASATFGKWLVLAGRRLLTSAGQGLDQRWLLWRELSITPRWHTQLLAGFFFYVVTYINFTGVHFWGISKPDHIQWAQKVARLDQRWDMFAPYPLRLSMYPVVVGTLRDGREIDARADTLQPPDWSEPDNMYSVYGGYRWRKYMNKMTGKNANNQLKGYGAWLCRRWNHPERPRNEQLATARVYFVRIHTDPARRADPPPRRMVWRHWCYAEFAPKN